MVHRSTLKTARALLDRFFRDAEGRTNHQLDVGFILADLGLPHDKADPALDLLVSRGLVNAFGPEVAFLTDEGIRACVEEVELEAIEPLSPPFGSAEPPDENPVDDAATEDTPDYPEGPELVHVRLDGSTTVRLSARCTIGRSPDNDIPIDDLRASKRHAVVRYDDGGYILEDLESANGTLLNGAYCVEPTRLDNEDEIVIGRTMLVYQAPPSFPPPEDLRPASTRVRVEPVGAPTARPGPVAPELAEPGIRVVRGRPDLTGDTASPSALFSSPPSEVAEGDVFDLGDPDEEAPRRDEETTVGGTDEEDASPFDLDGLAEELTPPDLGHDLPEFDQRPTPEMALPTPDFDIGELGELQPTLLGRESETLEDSRDAVLELSEIIEPPAAPPGTGPLELDLELDAPAGLSEPSGPEQDDRTVTMTMDVGAEDLPIATAELVDAEASPPEDSSSDAEATSPRFIAALKRLRAEVIAVAGSEPSPLLEAIDCLTEHPLVRAFADDDDPER